MGKIFKLKLRVLGHFNVVASYISMHFTFCFALQKSLEMCDVLEVNMCVGNNGT